MNNPTASETQAYFRRCRDLTDRLLERYLPPEAEEPRRLHQAMRYSTMAGGKRLRPLLAAASHEYCGGDLGGQDRPIHFAMAALEIVHTYSLIHDDLPCMDDDDLRRGIPTCHKKFDEATAVLAGDALHVVAFELMSRTGNVLAVRELAEAIGTGGMIGGQMADVEAEGRPVSQAEVVWIHRRKTAALIRCAVRLGAILASADDSRLAALTTYGEKIGLAFQIVDDILDIEGDQELLGKRVGSDTRNEKATYPGAVGLEQARHDAARLIDEGVAVFGPEEQNSLKEIAFFIRQRRN